MYYRMGNVHKHAYQIEKKKYPERFDNLCFGKLYGLYIFITVLYKTMYLK